MTLLRLKTLLSKTQLTSGDATKDSAKQNFSIFQCKICSPIRSFEDVELLNPQFKF